MDDKLAGYLEAIRLLHEPPAAMRMRRMFATVVSADDSTAIVAPDGAGPGTVIGPLYYFYAKPPPGTQVMCVWLPDSQKWIVLYGAGVTAAGCGDLSAYSPTDKSFSDDFTLTASFVDNFRFPVGLAPSVSGYYEVPVGRAWCVSDVRMKMTWVSGAAANPEFHLEIGNAYSFFMKAPDWSVGDVVDLSWPGTFDILTHGYRVRYWVNNGGSSGTVHYETGWTATEFDLAGQA